MRFKDFLLEKKPKGPEDIGYNDLSQLRDMQQHLTWHMYSHDRFQLFVPKHRDPKEAERIASNRRWWAVDREMRDAEKLKEESIPILTSFKETPPGDNKPSEGFWTSTAIKKKDGTYTSDWYEFVKNNFKTWQTDYGYLFEIAPNASVFDMEYADRFFQWAQDHNRLTVKDSDPERKFGSNINMRMRFPWDQLSHHFDGGHAAVHAHSEFLYGWDVESTVWFNTKVLKYKGAVKLFNGQEDDE